MLWVSERVLKEKVIIFLPNPKIEYRLEPNHMFKCKNCNNRDPSSKQRSTRGDTDRSLPLCHTVVEASSCYGFGPVWPACIYCGDRLVAELKKTGPYRDNIFELWILGKKCPFSSKRWVEKRKLQTAFWNLWSGHRASQRKKHLLTFLLLSHCMVL